MTLFWCLGPILAPALFAALHAGGIQHTAHNMVADARQILDPPAAQNHHRVLLQIVADAGDVGRNLHAVG